MDVENEWLDAAHDGKHAVLRQLWAAANAAQLELAPEELLQIRDEGLELSAMSLAAMNGHFESVKFLGSIGCDVDDVGNVRTCIARSRAMRFFLGCRLVS